MKQLQHRIQKLEELVKAGDIRAIRSYLNRFPDLRPDGRILGLAARFAGAPAVALLLERGAGFAADDGPKGAQADRYDMYVLNGWLEEYAPELLEGRVPLPDNERSRVVQTLCDADQGDFREMLYQAILHDDQTAAGVLERTGVQLPDYARSIVTGPVGVDLGAQLVSFYESYMRLTAQGVQRLIRSFKRLLHLDRLYLDPRMFYANRLQSWIDPIDEMDPRITGAEEFAFAASNTNLLRAVHPFDLVHGLLAAGNLAALSKLEPRSYLDSPERVRSMLEVLQDLPEVPADLISPVLALKLSETDFAPAADALSLDVDPFGEDLLGKQWLYRSTGPGTAQLMLYKGSDTNVQVPSRIAGHTVTSIHYRTFGYKNRRLGRRRLHEFPYITSITFPGTVHSLPGDVLRGSKNTVREVTVEPGVRELEPNCFAGAYKLTSVALPASIRAIGEGAFQGTALRQITLPDGIRDIEAETFRRCSSLGQITIPESVHMIGPNAFETSGLTRIIIPKNVRSIGRSAFAWCRFLEAVDVQGATEICRNAFFQCGSLQTVELAEGVERIGTDAFSECTQLEQVMLPASLRSVGKRAFRGSGLVKCELPPSLSRVPEGMFSCCSALEEMRLPPGLVHIDAHAFSWTTQMEQIVLPPALSSIGQQAFSCCGLTEVDIPPTVERIGTGAFSASNALRRAAVWSHSDLKGTFEMCSNLEMVWLSDEISRIGEQTFSLCSALRHIHLPVHLKTIGWHAFHSSGLESVTIPAQVAFVGENAFESCDALCSVVFEGEAALGASAFLGCDSLSYVELPEKLEEIPEKAFNGCRALTSIELPETIRSLGPQAFAESGLENVTVGAQCKNIGDEAFARCSALERADTSASTLGDGCFEDCFSLRSVRIGPLSMIPSRTFAGCISLAEFRIPESVRRIGPEAFAGTALKKIVIPRNVRRIDRRAFAECSGLREVVFEGKRPARIADDAFDGCLGLRMSECRSGDGILVSAGAPGVQQPMRPKRFVMQKGESND